MTDLTNNHAGDPTVPQPQTAAQTGRVAVKANRIEYSGLISSIFGIWFLNIFLTVITLGIYSFWGKTRMRKYLTSCFKVGGDHFEYTGTGKELFIGFLKVGPILMLIFIGMEFLPPLVQVGIFAGFFYLIGVAIYMAMRYRLNRLTWRGIRGRLGGSAFRFGGFVIWRFILNVVSLSYLTPASDLATFGYVANNAGFGNQRFKFNGNPANLIRVHFITLGIIALLIAVPAALVMGSIANASGGNVDYTRSAPVEPASEVMDTDLSADPAQDEYAEEDAEYGASGEAVDTDVLEMDVYDESVHLSDFGGRKSAMILGATTAFFLLIMLVPLVRSYYQAALMRETMRGLSLGDIRFKSTATGKDIIKLRLGNALILICTMWLAYPVVIDRKMRFTAKHTMIGGDLDSASFMQALREQGAVGEGLDDVFGIDTDFGLG